MPHQTHLDSDWSTSRVEPCAIAVPERVCAYVPDTSLRCCMSQNTRDSGIAVRESPDLLRTREDEVCVCWDCALGVHNFKRSSKSLAIGSDLRDASVFVSSTICATMPGSSESVLLRKSTSRHRSARASLILSPKQPQTSARVANGSCSFDASKRGAQHDAYKFLRRRFMPVHGHSRTVELGGSAYQCRIIIIQGTAHGCGRDPTRTGTMALR